LKIGFFTNSYLPISYGSVSSIEFFRRGLEERGHEVYIFAPRFWGYQDRNERVYRYPSVMYGHKIKYPLAWSFWPWATKKAREIGLDVVHVHQPFAVGKSGAKIAKKLGIPLVFTYHCHYENYTHYVWPIIPQPLLKFYVKKRAARFANKCDQVIAPSESVRGLLQDRRGVSAPLEVLPSGIDWSKFQRAKRAGTRKSLGIEDNEMVFLLVGRLEEEKNLNFLAEAIFPLLEKNLYLKMVFVGEGSLKKNLLKKSRDRKIEDRVIFTGLVPQEEIQDYYAAGDIFVHTSLSETQGLTVLEAMAAGLAVVAVRGPGVNDQLNHWKNGILTELDKEEFAEAAMKVVEDDKLRVRLGRNGKKFSKEMSYQNCSEKLEGIYQQAEQNRVEKIERAIQEKEERRSAKLAAKEIDANKVKEKSNDK
jgi:glycosyltransferase involved in cell wall biosynthesis